MKRSEAFWILNEMYELANEAQKQALDIARRDIEFVDLMPDVPVQRWISVTERTPSEADGTVWVCLADVFPYNEKEPYIDAKHDRRITEAFYSQFSKSWYKDGAVFPDGIVTHWMEKPQPPKEDAE